MTEKQLQANVVRLAKLLNWRVVHHYLSIKTEPGFPDLLLIRPPRMVVVELKSEKGKVTPAQEAWLDDFRAVLEDVYVWRPKDWMDGTIEGVLK